MAVQRLGRTSSLIKGRISAREEPGGAILRAVPVAEACCGVRCVTTCVACRSVWDRDARVITAPAISSFVADLMDGNCQNRRMMDLAIFWAMNLRVIYRYHYVGDGSGLDPEFDLWTEVSQPDILWCSVLGCTYFHACD